MTVKILSLSILTMITSAMAGRNLPARASFETDPKPVKLLLRSNPLDYAGDRIGLNVRAFELPLGYEGEYRFACRLPIIDQVSNQPLYLKQWAEDQSRLLIQQHSGGGITVVLDALKILCGSSWTDQIRTTGKFRAGLERSLSGSPFTAKYRRQLVSLYVCYAEALNMVKRSRAALSNDDILFFDANPGRYIVPDGVKMADLTGNADVQFDFIERARKIRLEYVMSAAQIMAVAFQKFVEGTKTYTAGDFYADVRCSTQTFVWKTPVGQVKICGRGRDTHEDHEIFLIDTGGDDMYRNNAGACRSSDDRVAVCIDHAGNDRYESLTADYAQGFGFMGAGFLIDMAGCDIYDGRHFSQGAGICGAGVVWDLGGDDRYNAQTFCQGAAAFGLGMVLDDCGTDTYDCASLGQGGATTLGMGVLSDLSGDDSYCLSWTGDKDALGQMPGYGQGGALSFRHYPWRKKLTAYGGIGMLLDGRGNDKYASKGWCVQGGSYIMSLGVLYDSAGDDTYYAHCGQGSGIHVTNAILIDRAGNDTYQGEFRCGGSGGDRSPGFLIDYQGDDRYRSKTSSYGTGVKPLSYSLFIDYQGNDTYECPEPKGGITFNNWDSFGGVWPESEPYLWPYAICLDLAGADSYFVRNRMNNSERHSFGHGIHIDMEWNKGDVFGTIENPLPPYRAFKIPEACRKSPYYPLLKELTDPHLFIRFQAAGRIVSRGPGIIPLLAQVLYDSPHRQVNRDIMECIHYFLARGSVATTHLGWILPLLNARDDEVRLMIADDVGLWGFAAAESLLIDVLATDTVPRVRRFALRSLLEFKSTRVLPLVRRMAMDDPSDDVRRMAVRYLSRILAAEDPYPLIEKALKKDVSPPVRTAAADALGHLRDTRALKDLRNAGKSYDVYLQRAAGRALAGMYQVDGIRLLIKSLSFPSIDAFFNYDRNVPNYIMAYTNHDLPDSVRYDQQQWQKWFNKNRKKIDLKTNADAFRDFTLLGETLKDSTAAAQLRGYETLLQRYPNQKIIMNRITALKEP